MGYHFREIICGYCEHRFVYNATPGEWEGMLTYTKKNGVKGKKVRCPKCNEWVLSFDDETVALPFELRDDKDEIETPVFYED